MAMLELLASGSIIALNLCISGVVELLVESSISDLSWPCSIYRNQEFYSIRVQAEMEEYSAA